MSYIFEALKKAEQEHHLGKVSNLETSLVFSKEEKVAIKWGWFISVVIGINILFIGFFLLWKQSTSSDFNPVKPVQPQIETSTLPVTPRHLAETSVLSEHIYVPPSEKKQTQVVKTIPTVISPPKSIVSKPAKTLEVSQKVKPVSYTSQTNLPHLEINVHVYDKNPQRRFVLLNGRRYKEGMYIQKDMKLKEIRTDDVVISYQQTEIFISRP